jgi:cytochrome P450
MTDPTAAARCPFTDPHRLVADLADARATAGLPRSDALDARVVARYPDVVAALHDPVTFSSRPTVPDIPPPFADLLGGRVPTRGTLLGHDDPDHGRLRSAVNGFFLPRRLARYESWIRERAHRVVDGFVHDGTVDLKPQFALPLPLQVISHLVGLDPDRHAWLHRSLGFFLGPGDPHPGTPQEKAVLLLELHDHLLELMEERRTDRRDDLISHVWDQRDSGAVEMSDFEMLSLFPGLMLAGHETTSNLICTGLSHLLADPARYEQAMQDDASRAAALEELLRYESAITGMRRLVTRDTELGGEQLHAGE